MIQLRPPADADNYRVKAGRFGDRFYTDPLPADAIHPATGDDDIYPAISTVKKASGQDWSKAMAKRLAKAPSQLVEIGKLDSESERKARINLLSDEGLGQASGRGTTVHAHAEAVLANRLPIYEMNEVVKPYIRTLDNFLAAYNPVLVAAEFVAINRHMNAVRVHRGNKFMGYGGTGDAVLEIDGKLWLVDWKSRAEDGDHKAYPEEGAQVAAYGRADYWIVGCDESPNGAKRIAPPDLAGGLIVSIKPDSYECFPIDLDEGFDYWTDLHAWWQARRSETRSVGRKWAPRVPVTSQLADESPSRGFIDAVAEADPGAAMAAAMELTPDDQAIAEMAEVEASQVAPTRASNRERFNALPEVKKGWAREAFKRKGVNPNKDGYTGEVSRILGEMEQRPTLRDAQETRAKQIAEHGQAAESSTEELTTEDLMTAAEVALGVDWGPDGRSPVVDLWEVEGGEASDELVNESRLLFDLVIGDHGKEWTGFRVTEANEAEVPFQVSKLRSMKRAHLYLALTTWAGFRGEKLKSDEAEGNIEFAGILFSIDGCTDSFSLGDRLGSLTAEQAERLGAEVTDVVQSETGGNPVTETETQLTTN